MKWQRLIKCVCTNCLGEVLYNTDNVHVPDLGSDDRRGTVIGINHDFLNVQASFGLKGSKYSLQMEFPTDLFKLAMITNTIRKRNYLEEY